MFIGYKTWLKSNYNWFKVQLFSFYTVFSPIWELETDGQIIVNGQNPFYTLISEAQLAEQLNGLTDKWTVCLYSEEAFYNFELITHR